MLHTQDDFLSAIAAAPSDRTLRLVYADWLDDHSDPRGALVRIEEEMRELPVFSDRFWELKPRRNALREQIGTEWCGRMRYGTECEPVFRHGIPDGWRERRRLIREFTERWHRVSMGDVGGRQKEIAEAEARLGRELPPSVREWVAFAFDARTNVVYHNVLRESYGMYEVPGQPAICILAMSEGDYYWGVQFSDLASTDPPIQAYVTDGLNGNYDTAVPDSSVAPDPTLTEFVLGYATGVRGNGGGFVTEVQELSSFLEATQATFPTPTRLGNWEIFELDNILMRVFPISTALAIAVEVFKPVPQAQVPNFLWEYARRGGSHHGMFVHNHIS